MIIYKEIFSAEVMATGCVHAETFGGSLVAIRYNSTTGTADVNGVPIVELDIVGNFGVVHGIDGILNKTLFDAFIQCPIVTPSLTPVVTSVPSQAPLASSTPITDPLNPTVANPATFTSSASVVANAYASFAAVFAMMAL